MVGIFEMVEMVEMVEKTEMIELIYDQPLAPKVLTASCFMTDGLLFLIQQ